MKESKKPRGGARPGAGMPAGYKTRKTKAREAAETRYLHAEGLTAVRVLEEMRRLAFSDIRGIFDEQGNLKPLHTLTAEQAAAIASVEVIVKNAQAGDGHTDTVHKVRIWDKTRALEQLGKHFGLLKETMDVQGGLTITWQESQS